MGPGEAPSLCLTESQVLRRDGERMDGFWFAEMDVDNACQEQARISILFIFECQDFHGYVVAS